MQRNARQVVVSWGAYVHYLSAALEALPDFSGTAYRALGGRDEVCARYTFGRPIQWGCFASASTDLVALKALATADDADRWKAWWGDWLAALPEDESAR